MTDQRERAHVLAAGEYSVALTRFGAGFSRWRDLAVTRWRDDWTRQDLGSFFYVRDCGVGALWSAGYMPTGAIPSDYRVSFTPERAVFWRSDGDLLTTLEVRLTPSGDGECRTLAIENSGATARVIEVTSYVELALAHQGADASHQAFAKMFVQTELATDGFDDSTPVLLAHRRRRSPDEPLIWAAHHAVVNAESVGRASFETDRALFLGRTRELHAPQAVSASDLSNTVGTVLDPVFALRYRVVVGAHAAVTLAFWTEVAESRGTVLARVREHRVADVASIGPTLPANAARVSLPPRPADGRTASGGAKDVGARDAGVKDKGALTSAREGLEYFNGFGGFANDGRDYVIELDERATATPMPWINVVSNESFGFHASAEGGGYTWSLNSRENQLTPWCNDPVIDRPSEVLYIQDLASDALWTATASPIRCPGTRYRACYGQGYIAFEHAAHSIFARLTLFVPMTDSIKIARLMLRNDSASERRLRVTAYAEWVLGTYRGAGQDNIVTCTDATTEALFACNPNSGAFGQRTAFADLGGRQTRWTADRAEFLGSCGRLDEPAGLLASSSLSGRSGAGLDPCAALSTELVLAPGESSEVIFLLGQAASPDAARALVLKYRAADLDETLHAVTGHWDQLLGAVQVKTPDRAMDLMLNRWLLYQALACRVWARSGFYQASGAYGFRDQSQDCMALCIAAPQLTRAHLVRIAGRQFKEGDVQHWWLPPVGNGVRTRISDDRSWLVYTAMHYLNVTGDESLLDEMIPFLEGDPVPELAHDAFYTPTTSKESATFFEHCARALDDSLRFGANGLPLFGTGDWNDGMNRVGEKGRGESVWLGWFLHAALMALAPLAHRRGETARATHWESEAQRLAAALESNGWDGAWYRRGYFDDGTPFGSAKDPECRIDAIAQSWSVLSNAARPERQLAAMKAVDEQLIRREDALALLFTPPFDQTPHDPGYIKGYPPLLRENGGQYTHAATWSVFAFARLRRRDRAFELFSLLNPVNHARDMRAAERYKVEPYVVAADVYSVPPLVGRGGWTWYTGSAAWLYRAGLEAVLGFQLRGGDRLHLTPCIPANWPGFSIRFRYGKACYDIEVENSVNGMGAVATCVIDGAAQNPGDGIALLDDARTHSVKIELR